MVQAETAPFMEYFLEPLTQRGYLKTFHCDLEMTRHALQHSAVCRVHITGANRTHDAIAWGTGVRPTPHHVPHRGRMRVSACYVRVPLR